MIDTRRRAFAALVLVTITLALSWALWTANTRPDLARSRTIPTQEATP